MGKPKWMVKREEKRAAAIQEAAKYVAEVNEKIDRAIQELRDKTSQLEDEKQRDIVLHNVNDNIKSLKKALADTPKFCNTAEQFKDMYDLVYSQIKGMIKTIDRALTEESLNPLKSRK